MALNVSLVCDACGLVSSAVQTDPNDVAIRGTLAESIRGWKRMRLGRDMSDLCPECAKKRLPEPTRPLHRAIRPKLASERETIPFGEYKPPN